MTRNDQTIVLPLHKFVELRRTLHELADHAHRHVPYSIHSPETREHFEDCPARSCKAAADALYRCVPDGWDERSGPADGWIER